MRKTLRALFLSSAMALGATGAGAQQVHVPGQMPQGPQPPSAEQQQTYELLTLLLDGDVQPAEPQLRDIESLEDDFYDGKMDEATYRASRDAMLRAMYPELATTHQEFGSRTNKIVGCTVDGRSYAIPVITLVSRADIEALTDSMIGTGGTNKGTAGYFAALNDLANRLRQGIEDHGAATIGTVTEAQFLHPEYPAVIQAALDRTATTAGRDTNVGVVFKMLPARELDVVCKPAAKPAPQTTTTAPTPTPAIGPH